VRTNLDSPQPTPAQLARKQRSIEVVKRLGLPYIEHLPVVEDEARLRARSREEIGQRGDRDVGGVARDFGVGDPLSPSTPASPCR
jgi:hypothetical protein